MSVSDAKTSLSKVLATIKEVTTSISPNKKNNANTKSKDTGKSSKKTRAVTVSAADSSII